ncbi:hypothetical protein BDV33DRAFT_95873 [Aspergillus novoparasiticus]|uniref:Uncharacterized protein n=1 Tax=Aspergillus novoparasiticus TaxID=986946 RepID=A0A5N6E6N2_9EURO|nr:hypothetical protein BDV33DRAFT_95873 [Aspergillus novoparasiticus]
MPQHLSSFQLPNFPTVRDEVIASLRPYFETEAFRAYPANATYVECIPDPAARTLLEPLLSLVFDGPARVIVSRIFGQKRLHASSLPCLHVPVLIYEPRTADDRHLEVGYGIYTDRGFVLNGKLVLITVIPTHIKVKFNPFVTPSLT